MNFTPLHLFAQMELEEEKKKWGKERGDMQEQIRKLLQACMEEERESEMARRREASAREQLGQFKHAIIMSSILCMRACIVQARTVTR